MTELLLSLALGAASLAGFPQESGGRISQPAIAVRLGGAPAVVVPSGGQLVALRADGGAVDGFPLPLGPGEAASGGAAAADMDGDGRTEVAVVTTSGRLFLWSGGLVRGFPVALGARARAGVSFGDVDGDGRPEVLVGDERGRVHAVRRNGREAAGWPAQVGAPVTSSVSSSGFAGGRSLALGCEDGKVHVLDASGREREGFPLATRFSVTGAPAFADLDDDGEMDLVVASQDFSVHAVRGTGKALPGFPVRAGYRVYEGPAIADLDGDGRLDVLFASADGMIHAVGATGEPLPGFPARVGARLFGGVSVGDLDRDGALDVVAVASDGTVAALDRRGAPLAGFPEPLGGVDVGASALLHDLAGDGRLAVLVGLPAGAMHALAAPSGGSRPSAAAPWPGAARDAARTGRYGPNPPSYKDLALSPATPRTVDGLRAGWRAVWLDAPPGAAAPPPRIEWLRDGKPVPALAGEPSLPAGAAKRGERWRFVASAAGGERSWESPEVRIGDTAPGAPAIGLEPPVPSRAADVRVVIRSPAVDPDGDPLVYETTWLLDGLATGVAGARFPAGRLRQGALLTARVVASDGTLAGGAAVAQARVANTAPGAPQVALDPPAPARTDVVQARVVAPAIDVDDDAVSYHHRWTVDGQPRNLPLSAAALGADQFRKHQKVELEVRAFDGASEGPPVRAVVTARNTPPGAPRVEIRPARPRRGEPLRASIVAPSPDPDGDAVAYALSWRKNGAPFAGALAGGREVPGAQVARGDRFELTVTPSDGEVEGPPAIAEVVVVNTPPTAPRVAIDPPRPAGGRPLRLVVLEPARDADGDPVALELRWTRDGVATGDGGEVLPPAAFRKHERVRVVATPRDLAEAGQPGSSEILVEDAPPTAPAIAFASDHPTVGAPLRVVIGTPAVDPDGDAISYQYRWSRDGAPVALPDATEASRAPPYWTSTSEVPARALRKGQRWAVEVRAHDGERTGPVARRATAIQNSPPPAPRLRLSPERPRRVDGIAVVLEPAPDADGDPLTYRYAWTRDGKRFDAPPDQAQVPRGVARKGERWAVEVVASDGEAESAPVREQVTVADAPPGPLAVSICDGPVPAGTVPEARIVAASVDPDGDAVRYRHEWTIGGRALPGAAGETRLAVPPLRKHDVVRVVVTPWDGELAGPPATAECEVANTPPTRPEVALEPAEAVAPRGVSVAIRRPSADRDGDPIVYRHAWWRDGLRTEHAGAAIPPGVLRHGETWRVEVTPFDGEDAGEPVTLETVVRNTPPPAPSVALLPPSPASGDAVTCEARAPQRDADQEPVTVHHRWFRDGRPETVGLGSAELPRGVVRRGERWRCEAWSSDGAAESARASAEVTVRNSPPGAPQVAIEPDVPRRGDDLTCRIARAAADGDDDPVRYGYAWLKNERPVPAGPDPARVDAARIAKGERWRCVVTASDGAAVGPPGSAERTVANGAPGPAVARVEPASPRTGERIRCEIVAAAQDPDGDAVRYRFAWERNGVAQPFAEISQEVPPRLVKGGDRWRCTVKATDGAVDGPPSGTEEAVVSAEPEPAPAPAAVPAAVPAERAGGRVDGRRSSK